MPIVKAQSEFIFPYEEEPSECNFQCLSDCPLAPGEDCLYDDPDIGMFDLCVYPEFFWWRFEQIFGNSSELLEITPDMMDEHFKEPEDKTQTRCPRCLSTEVAIGYPYIECWHCRYNEPLIDFPENVGARPNKKSGEQLELM